MDGTRPIPFELDSADEQQRQRKNASLFKASKIRLIGGFVSMMAIGAIGNVFDNAKYDSLFSIAIFLNILAIVVFLLKFKCPNCGTMPAGRTVSIYSGAAYAKGANPFAKRCACCGFYLSRKALDKAIRDLRPSEVI